MRSALPRRGRRPSGRVRLPRRLDEDAQHPRARRGYARPRRARRRRSDRRPRPRTPANGGGTALNAIHALATALTALFPENGRLPGHARGRYGTRRRRARGLGRAAARRGRARPRRRRPARRACGRGVLRARVRGALGRRDRDPRRQAGPAEHDARLARLEGVTIRVAPGQELHEPRPRPRHSSATRSPAGATMEVAAEATPLGRLLPRDTDALRLARRRSPRASAAARSSSAPAAPRSWPRPPAAASRP